MSDLLQVYFYLGCDFGIETPKLFRKNQANYRLHGETYTLNWPLEYPAELETLTLHLL